jgi:hypothetical protein
MMSAFSVRGRARGFFRRDHDAEVDDFVVVAGEDDADDVLADVVDVALDGGEEDLALGLDDCCRRRPWRLFGFHEGREVGDGLLHHAGGFDDLGQEHFARAEEIADDAHAVHERAFDDFERRGVPSLTRASSVSISMKSTMPFTSA